MQLFLHAELSGYLVYGHLKYPHTFHHLLPSPLSSNHLHCMIYRVAQEKYPCVIQYNLKTRKAITLKQLSFHSIMAYLNCDIQLLHSHAILTEVQTFQVVWTFKNWFKNDEKRRIKLIRKPLLYFFISIRNFNEVNCKLRMFPGWIYYFIIVLRPLGIKMN